MKLFGQTLTFAALAIAALVFPADAPAQKKKVAPPSPHYHLKPSEFPPEGSSKYIAGELIAVDRLNRKGVIRVDRTDAQSRSHFDLPLAFDLLPYGVVRYRGAPAELRDIPLGTHLHGEFFYDHDFESDPANKKAHANREITPDSAFNRALRLEDDFSYHSRLGRHWQVETVDLEKGTLTVLGVDSKAKPDSAPTIFHVNATTRVWKGRGFASLAELVKGQSVQVNLTICTLRGPGRCTDIWLDSESRAVASAHQLEIHRQYQREHGLAGWIDSIDDKTRIMTVTLFEGFDPELKVDFSKKVVVKEMLVEPFAAVAVAESSLRTYDPINDVKRGGVLAVKSVPTQPGSSGVQISLQMSDLLEGFRRGRIVRLYAGVWGVTDLPREEKLFR